MKAHRSETTLQQQGGIGMVRLWVCTKQLGYCRSLFYTETVLSKAYFTDCGPFQARCLAHAGRRYAESSAVGSNTSMLKAVEYAYEADRVRLQARFQWHLHHFFNLVVIRDSVKIGEP